MTVAERVDHLDEVLSEFITSVGIEFNKLYNSQMRTEAELRAFKEDTQAFKEEMRVYRETTQTDTAAFKEEMRAYRETTQTATAAFKEEMRAYRETTQTATAAFKEEMRAYRETTQTATAAFKEEMRAFKEEGRQQNREMNRRWGELANKLGTLVEDLVAPSLPHIVQEVLGQEVIDLSVRRKRKRADGRQQEYDALAVTPETVCLASVKSTLRSADIDHLLNEELPAFRTFFPEYQSLPVVGLVASLAVDDSVLHYAERQGLIVLAIGDQLMEVKNTPGFIPRRY